MATRPKQGEEQTENKVQDSTPSSTDWKSLPTQHLQPPRRGNGERARMACRTWESPQRCATSTMMQRPGRKLKRRCSR